MTDKERIDRLEQAFAELAGGVDWCSLRARRRPDAMRAIQAEQEALRDIEDRATREAKLEAELAAMRAA
jgi:hypothetical protein